MDELLRTVTVTLHRHTDYTAVWTAVADHRQGRSGCGRSRAGRDAVTVSAHPLDSGIIGQVVRTGKQALLGRSHLADAGGAWAAAGYESLLATPVVIDRRCEAVIGLSDLRADQFDDSDALLMRTLAEQVAAALRGAALREESDRRATRLNVVAEVARALRAPETVEQALHDAAQAISRYTGYSGLTAWLVEPAMGRAPGGLCARPRHRRLHRAARPGRRRHPGGGDHCGQGAAPRPRRRPPRLLLAGPRPEQLRPDRPRDGRGTPVPLRS